MHILNNEELAAFNKVINNVAQKKVDDFHTCITGLIKKVSNQKDASRHFGEDGILTVDIAPDGIQTDIEGLEKDYPTLEDIPLYIPAGSKESYIYSKAIVNSRVLVFFTEENAAAQINNLSVNNKRKKIYNRGNLSNAIAVLLQPIKVYDDVTSTSNILINGGDGKILIKNKSGNVHDLLVQDLNRVLDQIITVLNSLAGGSGAPAIFTVPASTITSELNAYKVKVSDVLE